MMNSNSWPYNDKQVTQQLSNARQPPQQQKPRGFFDQDDEEEDDQFNTLLVNPIQSKPNPLPDRHQDIQNSAFLEGMGFPPVVNERDGTSRDRDLVVELDRRMKMHVDNVLHAVDGLSERITHLQGRIIRVEGSVDYLKESVEYNNGKSDGKLRELENILREVQGGVKDLKDRQEIAEAQLELAKLQLSKDDLMAGKHKTDSTQETFSCVPQQSHQLSQNSVASAQPPAAALSSIPPSPHHQNPFPTPAATAPQLPTQSPNETISSIPQHESYRPSPVLIPEVTNQQYHQPPPSVVYQPNQQTRPQTTHMQYNVASAAPPHQPYQPATPQLPPVSQSTLLPQLRPPYTQAHNPVNYQPEQVPYVPSHSVRNSFQPPGGFPQPQQFHSHPPSRPPPEFFSGYSPSSEHYKANYSSNTKPLQTSQPPSASGGGSSYSKLPTVKVLPHALPTASSEDSTSTAAEGGANKVPVDVVVDKVTAMGFRRDLVRATVKKLTENGQTVDLNAVLDKLMNGG